tara:strand:+ start:358 stop:840 length:483 start_codon:yes stop_codon:yes gene_type:complete
VTSRPYTIFGYKGKQVRDNIHSHDLVQSFWHFHQNPRCGEVYNMGGSRHSNCSVLETIQITEKFAGRKLKFTLSDDNRIGDHIWWIYDVRKFQKHYPNWNYQFDLKKIISQIVDATIEREKVKFGITLKKSVFVSFSRFHFHFFCLTSHFNGASQKKLIH